MNVASKRSVLIALWLSMFALGARTTVSAAVEPAAPATVPYRVEAAAAERAKRFLDDALHASSLRLRVMTGRMFDTADDHLARTFTPIDVLAESARGSTDPMVLALLIDACGNERIKPKPTCDALDLAKRWTVAETQNQLSWLTLSSVLRARGDLPGARAAFERASTASLWHEYLDDAARVFAAAIPRDLGGQARLALLELGQTIAALELQPLDAGWTFYSHCKEPSLRDACIRIIDTIARDGSSAFSLQLAIGAAKRVGVDAATVESRRRAFDALIGISLGNVPRDA